MKPTAEPRSWTFLTNHAHVLLAISATPDLRLKDIAERVAVTERTAMQIVTDLERSGIIERQKRGRRNHYVVQAHHPLRRPLVGAPEARPCRPSRRTIQNRDGRAHI